MLQTAFLPHSLACLPQAEGGGGQDLARESEGTSLGPGRVGLGGPCRESSARPVSNAPAPDAARCDSGGGERNARPGRTCQCPWAIRARPATPPPPPPPPGALGQQSRGGRHPVAAQGGVASRQAGWKGRRPGRHPQIVAGCDVTMDRVSGCPSLARLNGDARLGPWRAAPASSPPPPPRPPIPASKFRF